MILNSTTDNLQIVLDKSITTSGISFCVFFSEYTTNTLTPLSNYSSITGTSAVNLISSPSAGTQRQLRYCSINNTDTVDTGVKIIFNDNGSLRNILYVFLKVNESIQYSNEMGWRVYDSNGSEKISGFNKLPSSIRMPEFFPLVNATTAVSLTNTNCFCVYLGRAERPFSSINIRYRVTTQITATIAWAELAIYKGNPTLLSATTMTYMGHTDTSGVWNSTGQKTTNVLTPNMSIGDNLWAVFSNSTTGTVTSLRAGMSDNLGAGFYQTVTNKQPSLNTTLTGTLDSSTSMIWLAWQGVYQGT